MSFNGGKERVTRKLPDNNSSSPLNAQGRAKVERYLETQRARPQARPLPSASMALNRIMRPLASKSAKRGGSAKALLSVWSDIMGPRWSKISTPIRFRTRGHDRTLVISAPGAAASLIQAASGQILDRINAHIGEPTVTQLQIIQSAPPHSPEIARPKRGLTPSEEAELREGLTHVDNKRLRIALERLGREIIRNQP